MRMTTIKTIHHFPEQKKKPPHPRNRQRVSKSTPKSSNAHSSSEMRIARIRTDSFGTVGCPLSVVSGTLSVGSLFEHKRHPIHESPARSTHGALGDGASLAHAV